MEPLAEAEVCANIGPRERRIRNITGIVGTLVGLLLVAALIETQAPRWWRLTAALPFAVAAFGFMQARAKTCVAFARKGVRVLGDSRKGAERVTDVSMIDRIDAQARSVYVQSGIAVAIATVLVLAIP